MRLGDRVDLPAFQAALAPGEALDLPHAIVDRLAADRHVVEDAVQGPEPVYGLNTGLGANLGHRIAPGDVSGFQRQLIEGRAVAEGDPLPQGAGRGIGLARVISAAGGGSGLSVPVLRHLVACHNVGFDPVVPCMGSIGASDLTQNAVWALAVLGQGRCWHQGGQRDASEVLRLHGLTSPDLQPKDAMGLINHGGLTVALSASALSASLDALFMVRQAVLLSYAGYEANTDVLRSEVNALRNAPGQAEVAAWLLAKLQGATGEPRRIQEALSFRTVAPVLGAAEASAAQATRIWEDEANGLSDSPAVQEGGLQSTSNFVAPALRLALDQVAAGCAMVATASVQRMQRLMDPQLSGLPRYLAPGEGASAGLVPLQKTMAGRLSAVMAAARSQGFDVSPVSASVEDFAPLTPQAALKLSEVAEHVSRIAAAEALVASQAIDLRGVDRMSPAVRTLHGRIRAVVPFADVDRPLGDALDRIVQVLR